MTEKNKPWPDNPPAYRERVIIQRGLQFYFSCVMCRELGWKKDCMGKDACGKYLYAKIQEHYRKWESINAGHAVGSVRR